VAFHKSARNHILLGLLLVVLLVGGLGLWAGTTKLAGAVIASGTMVVDSSTKKVQHPTGGIVGEVLVKDGDHVNAGDLLVRLDDTITKANLAIVENELIEQLAQKARLEAERDGGETVIAPTDLGHLEHDPRTARAMAGEERIFEMRRVSRVGQKAQLQQRIGEIGDQVRGLEAQVKAKGEEVELITRERQSTEDLWKRNLMPISRYTELERDATRVEAEKGQLVATLAETRGKSSETELQILQVDRDFNSEVSKDLRETEAKISELQERRVTAEDQLRRVDIKAPQSGFVLQSTVHTIGGVINPGEVIMLIVPEQDKLVAETRVSPQEIDQLHTGQTAALRFSSFDQRTTPEILGTVVSLSADTTMDQRTGTSYYTARIATAPEELAKLGSLKLIAGMPVEAFIKTTERTALSFLIKPLRDQIARAFREK